MKLKIALSFFLIFSSLASSFGQFSLKGRIVNFTGKEELQLNVPLVFGFYKENSQSIKIAKDGTFAISLPIKEIKFANLIFKRRFFTMLFSPDKNLTINLNAADTTLKLINGSAFAENKVMQLIDLEEYPFFFENEKLKLEKLSYDQLQAQVLRPYYEQRDKKINMVMTSKISSTYKNLITSELNSIAYNYLNDLARTSSINKSIVNQLVIDVFDKSIPKPLMLPAGPQFYAFLDNYIRYLETKAFIKLKAENIPSNQPIPYFGISLDSANIFVKKFSKTQWRFLGATKNLQPILAEEYGYQLIKNLISDKDYRPAIEMAQAYKLQFPRSKYLNTLQKNIEGLRFLLADNENNMAIKVMANFENVHSIYEVIKSLKGKVVYLDIWGTWCGPCKEELKYIPQLKAKFKDKDIAYVYLDLDDDQLDGSWRQFIKVNKMEGLHLRKTRETIVPFWKELLADAEDKSEYYPQYFIFDRTGKLVVSKAKRPSEKDELYKQLDSVLNLK